jgi:hypothetical protein
MTRKTTLGALAGLALFLTAGCADLAVDNLNNPDRSRALASPSDVESLIGSAYLQYFTAAQYYNNGNALNVAADHGSSSWGNFGMRDISWQPRKTFDNNSSYNYAGVTEAPWTNTYAGVAAAGDGLRAIEGGLEIGDGGEDTERAKAIGRFAQGVGHCFLAMLFDQAFIVDESTDLAAVTPDGYTTVGAAGLGYLDDAITLSTANSFTTEPGWFGDATTDVYTNTEMVALARSYKARCRALMPRDPTEKAAVEWGLVIGDADNGVTEDFAPFGDGVSNWWSGIKTLGGSNEGWTRADMHWVGQADVSGGYQAWVSTPVAQRQPFDVDSPDKRLPAYPPDDFDEGNGPSRFTWFAGIPHPPERGTYHLSHYSPYHWIDYKESSAWDWTGDISELTVTEMNLYMAEGHIRNGNPGAAATLINLTRAHEDHGGLTPVTGAGPVPNEPGGGCVPYPRFDTTQTCGDLFEAMKYEYLMEVFQVSAGLSWAQLRGWGDLIAGTVIQLPIPGSELETLQLDYYTFGGAGMPGGAPGTNESIGPSMEELRQGGLEVALSRAAYSLDRIRERQEQNKNLKPVVVEY